MSQQKFQLPNTVSSSQDLAALVLEMREYTKWYQHNAIKQRLNSKRGTPPPVMSPGAMELIRAAAGKGLLTQAHLDELVKSLETFKSHAETITITLAAPPAADLKQKLVGWCRDNVDPGILVAFQFNATLLGGMVVRYGSRVFDWSFRREILAARVKFPEVLRRV